MVIIKKAKNDSGIRGGLRSIGSAIREESIEALKVTSKELVRGVTMLPRDLLTGALGGEPGADKKSWEDEWLKDKDKNNPPVSEKEGQHSKIDPAQMMKGSEEQKLQMARNRIASALNSQYTHASSASEYGKEQAQKYQQEHEPIHVRLQREADQQRQQQQQAAAQQPGPVGPPSGKTKGRPGKQKHQPSPMELNRAEFRGAKGK
ncbi:MAG: hypothetical protein WC775_05835 [Patescibacteria group bacterium]